MDAELLLELAVRNDLKHIFQTNCAVLNELKLLQIRGHRGHESISAHLSRLKKEAFSVFARQKRHLKQSSFKGWSVFFSREGKKILKKFANSFPVFVLGVYVPLPFEVRKLFLHR